MEPTLPPPPSPDDYRVVLLKEYFRRKARNPRYSLRSFSRSLGVSRTALSDVLGKRRHLSHGNVLKVAEKLGFAPAQVQEAVAAASSPRKAPTGAERYRVEDDLFALIADWHHYAILSLAETADAVAAGAWIGERLGITRGTAEAAVERLVRLELLEVAGGRMRPRTSGVTTQTDVPSGALRKHHRQNLELAERALEEEPLGRRDITSITVAADPDRMREAKARIAKFRRSLARFLEKGEKREVYTLAIQLFPLTRLPPG